MDGTNIVPPTFNKKGGFRPIFLWRILEHSSDSKALAVNETGDRPFVSKVEGRVASKPGFIVADRREDHGNHDKRGKSQQYLTPVIAQPS
ncbi:MAG: hypothetical protein ACJA16_003795 [Akkermansiaceae bacterium]|jgi:hypothetical protein